ncbi:hypothetical protein K438DRAFT_1984148 [Mycena galopus ATCC 62051]|nr:hypothetical protein K438DRAFT_1984148 [Mycena galopus ATCC 62051]
MVSSNIETADHKWLADFWPADLQFRQALGIADDGTAPKNFEVVPRTFQALFEWAYVGTNVSATDRSRIVRLLYKDPPIYKNVPSKVIYPVGVRVQGFVDSCNLRKTGNYKKGMPPQAALQAIVLSGGAYEHVFAQYRAAVFEVVNYIRWCLGVKGLEATDTDRKTMFIARRVFSKVNAKNCHEPSVLEVGDDPLNDAAAVSDTWRIIKKASIGMYVPDEHDPDASVFAAMDAFNVRAGDFVDVCVGFDIVTRGNGSNRTVKVHLTMEHVLMLQPTDDPKETATGGAEEVVEEEAGLTF